MISEDVQHAIFHWTTHRAVVEIVAGVILSPEIIVNHMLASETTCWVVKMKNYSMKAVHNMLRKEELQRRVVNKNTSRT